MSNERNTNPSFSDSGQSWCHFDWRKGNYSWDLNLTDPILSEIPVALPDKASLHSSFTMYGDLSGTAKDTLSCNTSDATSDNLSDTMTDRSQSITSDNLQCNVQDNLHDNLQDNPKDTVSDNLSDTQQGKSYDKTQDNLSDTLQDIVYDAVSRTATHKTHDTYHTTPELILGALLYFVGVLGVSFLLATVSWRWANDLLALNKPSKAVSVTIADSQTVGEVADAFKENGLIEYKQLFELFANVTHKADKISAGTYELNTEMDYSALLNSISSSSKVRETVTVTIPEGYTVQEAFQLLSSSGVCTLEQLNATAESTSFDYDFLKNAKRTGVARLEGYLFPDTYEFYKGADPTTVISRMLSNFEQRMDKDLLEQQKESGFTLDEIIIMASIIEKETTGTDRSTISSVIHNRLADPTHDNIKGCLQMDSTVQYILPERKEHLTEEDIAINSPYNTYVVQGLPVGPICNAGLSAIKAALQPDNTNYYYFMLGDDGEDHFFNDGSSFYSFKNALSEE